MTEQCANDYCVRCFACIARDGRELDAMAAELLALRRVRDAARGIPYALEDVRRYDGGIEAAVTELEAALATVGE